MTQLDPSPLIVSAVRAAMALPIILFALPAGVLADRLDRRRLLLVTQCWLLAAASYLAVLCYTQRITPAGLLLLTLATGLGMVLHTPTWQASIPELVPRRQLIAAIALGSISFNLARAAGPALGGILISTLDTWAAFALNALSFAGVILVLLLWRREETESHHGKTFFASLTEGVRFVFSRPPLRHPLARVILFVVPGGGLWGLLPLVARETLQWDARGYGILVGMIGLGALLCAGWMPRLRYHLKTSGVLTCGHLLMAAGMLGVAASPGRLPTALLMLLCGSGWMMTLTTLNSSTQMALPNAFRARGMGCYLTSFAVAMGGGSLLWGALARETSLSIALAAGGVTLLLGTLVGRLLPIDEPSSLLPSDHLPATFDEEKFVIDPPQRK